ncbi:cytochrome c oxidase subunit II [Pyrinomonas methylaliphatogenes]|jgi:cytochrome c oxidase subunit 2|nr:cytochrome c oxidase subunit II [Pyrinomonas methylaliphatogenes]MBX5479758.1 cytochrome c oxidase subunit II [Pyrinomonas methylaliphatogenes]
MQQFPSELKLMPEQASTIAQQVDALFYYWLGITLFFTVLIVAAIILFVVKYRRRAPGEIPRPIFGSMKLETIWIVIPFLIAMSLFVWGAKVYFAQYRIPKDALDIYVVGKQWMWKMQHPTGQREINELHVPMGRKIRLTMTTEDVIHSFYIPDFRVKMDVVPGRYTQMWFEATKPGRYHLFCAEYCGMNHSRMTGTVIVMRPDEYQAWLSGNTSQLSPAQQGEQLFQTLGCTTCHLNGGRDAGGRGPQLAGIFGKPVQLEGGQTVVADENYLRESILNPSAKIVAGYSAIMPTYQGQVSEEQLLQLIAYIKSLSPQSGNAAMTSANAAQAASSPNGQRR